MVHYVQFLGEIYVMFHKIVHKIFFTLSFSFKFVSITMIWLFCSQIIFQNADTVFSVGPEQNENINIYVIIYRMNLSIKRLQQN